MAFLVPPHILHQKDKYYLTYQVDTKNTPAVRTVIGEKMAKGKYYYFVTGKVSFAEYNHPVTRPVPETPEVINLLKSGNFFWLHADGSETPLSITEE
ncbi:hypothetical protein FLA_0061 [Filimonas lacunae]|nr:hypothetical protein FLA_0061 [Filimonas lacunae]